jgi:hypothetical protein
MLKHLRERYPHLGHDDLVKLAGQIGYDFDVVKIPQRWTNKTSERSGETLTVLGARGRQEELPFKRKGARKRPHRKSFAITRCLPRITPSATVGAIPTPGGDRGAQRPQMVT